MYFVLKINFLNLKKNQSEFLPTIQLHMDISAKDTALHTASARVNLDLHLVNKRKSSPSKASLLKRHSPTSTSYLHYGFRKAKYVISITSIGQLKKGAHLLRLSDEFVAYDASTNQSRLFKPFSLRFYTPINASSHFIRVEPSQGLVYLSASAFEPRTGLNLLDNDGFLFSVRVNCHWVDQEQEEEEAKSALLVVSLERSVVNRLVRTNDLIYRPVWGRAGSVSEAFVFENVPAGTLLQNYTLVSQVDAHIWRQTQLLSIFGNVNYAPQLVFYLEQYQERQGLFEVVRESGAVRLLYEPDYEVEREHSLTVRACLPRAHHFFGIEDQEDDEVCFEQRHTLTVRVLNKNDNEPHFAPLQTTQIDLSTRQLVPSMTLIELSVVDLDGPPLEELRVRTFNETLFEVVVKEEDTTNTTTTTTMSTTHVFKLSETGYGQLVKMIDDAETTLIEIVCEVSDGLFANRVTFNLSVSFDQDDEDSLVVVPIVHTLELRENTRYTSRLLNLSHVSAASSKKRFKLKNYENLFILSEDGFLNVRRDTVFDRETRDVYELFIEDLGRVLVNILDENDNAPHFSVTTAGQKEIRFHTWPNFLASNRTHPLCSFLATDPDQNSLLSYEMSLESASSKALVSLNANTGEIYYKGQDSNIISTIHNDDTTTHIIAFTLTVQDASGLNSSLAVELHLTPNVNIFAPTTFYHFRVPESTELGRVFGRVHANINSTNMYYRLEEEEDGGNLSTKTHFFDVDYLSGELSVRVRLDYETRSTHYFRVRADASSTCVIRVDVIDVNDNAPTFAKREYKTRVDARLAKMSPVFALSASDADKPNTPNSAVRFQLLDHLDTFYVDELSGIIYNKIALVEAAPEVDNYQVSVMVYDLGDYPISLGGTVTAPSQSLNETCSLKVEVERGNEHAPHFEKTVYTSHIEIDYDANNYDDLLDDQVSRTRMLMSDLLLDTRSPLTSNGTHQFIAKVNAQDADDSSRLVYSLETPLFQQSLFSIDHGNKN